MQRPLSFIYYLDWWVSFYLKAMVNIGFCSYMLPKLSYIFSFVNIVLYMNMKDQFLIFKITGNINLAIYNKVGN